MRINRFMGKVMRPSGAGRRFLYACRRGLLSLGVLAGISTSLNGFAVERMAAAAGGLGLKETRGKSAPVIPASARGARLDAGNAGGAPQRAGKVSAAIPEEFVQRGGEGSESPLKLSDYVYWQDLVRTLETGRARIGLLDGSFLNIGARSTMRIIKHDPQSQQTELEMSLGRLRGEVVKITKPDGGFQVRTQTAVIGVVGTVFIIEALPDRTNVFCLQGVVSVRSLDPAVAGEVTLHAGQSTVVPRGLPPTGPAQYSTPHIHSVVSQTNVQVGTAAALAPTAGVASTVTSAVGVNAATVGVVAAAAGISGAALSAVGHSANTLGTLTSTATAGGNVAAAAAAAASAVANPVTSATTSLLCGVTLPTVHILPCAPVTHATSAFRSTMLESSSAAKLAGSAATTLVRLSGHVAWSRPLAPVGAASTSNRWLQDVRLHRTPNGGARNR